MDEDLKQGQDDSLGFDAYQAQAWTTNCYPVEHMVACLVAGLASEAGEVAGKFKKALRDEGDARARAKARHAMIAEIGDVLWYCACLARECGVSLKMVARANLVKLADRQQRGVIGGSGDER